MEYLRVGIEGEIIDIPLADSNHAIETLKKNYERAANRDLRELCKVCTLKVDLCSICLVEDVFVSVLRGHLAMTPKYTEANRTMNISAPEI